MNQIYVKKNSGEMQLFSEEKLKASLEFTGASEEDIQHIMNHLSAKIYDGITTRSIYNLAFKELRSISRPLSAYYGTKRALLDMGPDGFLFEKYIARIMSRLGFSTKTGVWIEGRCISHEVDVVAESSSKNILIECKFHNAHERHNDIKTALYVKARANDILEGKYGDKYDEFWLVSNTKFSDDAIRYSTCAGLHLWGSNFPPQDTLQDTIRDHGLDPITCLSSLKKGEKRMLLESDVFLTSEVFDSPNLLRDIGLDKIRIDKVISEIRKIKARGVR